MPDGLFKLNYWDEEKNKRGNYGIYIPNSKVVEIVRLLFSKYKRKQMNFYPDQHYQHYLVDTAVISFPTEFRRDKIGIDSSPCFSLIGSTQGSLENLAVIFDLPFDTDSIIGPERYFP